MLCRLDLFWDLLLWTLTRRLRRVTKYDTIRHDMNIVRTIKCIETSCFCHRPVLLRSPLHLSIRLLQPSCSIDDEVVCVGLGHQWPCRLHFIYDGHPVTRFLVSAIVVLENSFFDVLCNSNRGLVTWEFIRPFLLPKLSVLPLWVDPKMFTDSSSQFTLSRRVAPNLS